MISADEGLERLKRGNREFVEAIQHSDTLGLHAPPAELVAEQRPFAIVLGCSDARVPAEIVFNQGLGDLFVIRVAGNIVTPSQVGSVEFAASAFGTPLVVVLGHTQCGAVTATYDELHQPAEGQSPNLKSIVDCVRPAVAPIIERRPEGERTAVIREAIEANVRQSVAQLRRGSPILTEALDQSRLRIVGAEYAIETGEVRFIDELD